MQKNILKIYLHEIYKPLRTKNVAFHFMDSEILVYGGEILKSNIMVLQVRDYREDWNLTVTQLVAGNYYPVIF